MTSAVELDEFAKAYVVAALWSSTDEATPNGGEPLDKNYDIEDIDPETLAQMAADCERFQSENVADLASYNHPQFTAEELGGHDFWLTRNGHGAGFWDRDCLPQPARDRLTEASKKYGEYHLYVGDDGVIYGAKG